MGLEITHALLMAKVQGQSRVLRQLGQDQLADYLATTVVDTLEATTSLEDARSLESHAASAYWQVWESQTARFARKDQDKIPAHWTTFGKRKGQKGLTTRNATTPGNALVNYLYAFLETQTRIALLTVGLDPGLGILHTDRPDRDSMALDVTEPCRSDVDSWLLALLRERTFAESDFFERPDGGVRITASLTRELAMTAPTWAKVIAPWAERVAQQFVTFTRLDAKLPTRLANTKLRQARAAPSVGRTPNGELSSFHGPKSMVLRPEVARTCPECGTLLTGEQERFCSNACRATHSHGGEAGRKRGQTNAVKARERQKWEQSHPDVNLDALRERFTREIQPKLQAQAVPLSKIQAALGISLRYASQPRRGQKVAHPMHFAALEALVELSSDGGKKNQKAE